MLVDDVTITVKAGDGGDGFVHFFRAGHNPFGGPDGGNGGKGGDVIILATHNLSDLSQFSHTKKITAQNGVNGKEKKMHGKNGDDVEILVPLGTSIIDEQSGLDEMKPFIIARGGKGGRGNTEFKSATNRAPEIAEDGVPGEFKEIRLVMKLIAQIGLIGKPNAGKSSLLSALTNAAPKIGSYPFTTLEPNLGVLADDSGNQIVLADIPGLIEGAHEGRGLGIKFLKHIEKTELLVHCLDITDPDIVKTYQTIREEFEAYDNGVLLTKPEIVLLTKTDLVQSDVIDKTISKLKKLGKQIYTVSIYDAESLSILSTVLKQKLS
ncbi:MAG TPA: Obg family GTPase CgtA [Candidatus Levybacteria bacterium]|nr:Obg family GTPase CgtA [Candidatus Levybacteria bacterium]